MAQHEDMNVFGKAAGDPDPTDELVRDYLDAQASEVDGAALLERARRTRRRGIWARRAGLVAAAAASVAIVLLAYNAAAPRRVEHDPAPPREVAVDTPSDSADPMESLAAATNIGPMLPDAASAIENFGETFAQSRATLASDAKCLKEELGGLVSTSLTRAGLFL